MTADRRDSTPQKSTTKKNNRRRGGNGKSSNIGITNSTNRLADVSNISSLSLSRSNVTKVQ